MMSSAPGDANPYSAPESKLGVADIPVGPHSGGMTFGEFLLAYFFGSFFFMWIFWAVFWSVWMSWFIGWDFLSVLVSRGLPGGFFVALFPSIFIVGYFGVFMRQKSSTIPFTDRGEFVGRLDREMKKRRYRSGQRDEKSFVFMPKALIRTRFFNVVVNVNDGEATMTGPGAVINLLSKQLQKSEIGDRDATT
jgi:hypothetical protein